MTAADLRQIGAAMSVARMRIPQRNRAKFDIEAQDFFAAITAAAQAHDDTRIGFLTAKWNTRVQWLTESPRCHVAPPCLVRRDGETAKQYLNRCRAAERN